MKKLVKPDEVTVVIDTREQLPLDMERYGLKTIRGTLRFGDYSLIVPDLRSQLVVERKSLPDMVMCCGKQRQRFEKELQALRGFQYRFVVCEFTVADILGHQYRSQITPQSVLSSISKWLSQGIPFIMAGDDIGASYIVAKLLYFRAREIVRFSRMVMKADQED